VGLDHDSPSPASWPASRAGWALTLRACRRGGLHRAFARHHQPWVCARVLWVWMEMGRTFKRLRGGGRLDDGSGWDKDRRLLRNGGESPSRSRSCRCKDVITLPFPLWEKKTRDGLCNDALWSGSCYMHSYSLFQVQHMCIAFSPFFFSLHSLLFYAWLSE
jgi:hypothetical protein